MDPQIIIALIAGLGAGISAGLLARGRISLRCPNCGGLLPPHCTDLTACNRRRDEAELQRVAD